MKNPFNYLVSLDKLRACQAAAYRAAVEHYATDNHERNVIIQLPTGTGKTALIAALPFGIAKHKVLILTPNVKLARDMVRELDIIDNPQANVYRGFAILSDPTLKEIELFVLRLESTADAGDIHEHQIVVSNYQQLQDIEKWFADEREAVDLIVIDEAHHQAANTYQEIIDFFPNAKVVGLTATPFRSDGKRIEGKFIYKYSFNQAIRDRIIRNLFVVNVAPEEIELEFTDENKKRYSLKDVLSLKEDSWFQRGIALSQDCCDSIARKASDKLNELRSKFPEEGHQIIACAISKRHARENVKPSFEKLGLKVGLVSSAIEDTKTNDETFNKLAQGKIDVIVNIGMLGEGFNHPPLGVAAIFRPYKTLNPYMQFIGRVLRNNGKTPVSYIVSHVGLNQLQRFEEFKMFDYEDQDFLGTLFSEQDLGEEGSAFVDPAALGGKQGQRRPDITPRIREMGERAIEFESQFVADGVANALNQFESLDPRGREVFLQTLGIDPAKVRLSIGPKEKRLKPVEKRKAARNLLNEREKSVVTDILKTLNLEFYGRNFNKRFKNFVWVKRRVSKLVNRKLGISRQERKSITNSMFEEIEAKGIIAGVARESTDYFRNKLSSK